jgi:uncharacterized iron-regulated protein
MRLAAGLMLSFWATSAAGQAPASLEAVIASAAAADIVILGEIHDNPEHHRNQADIVRALQPAALVFEMIPQAAEDTVNALREEGADRAAIAEALDWEASGWPDFAHYAQILEAAPGAQVFGAGQLDADVGRALSEGAAAAFGPDAATYGLDLPLPPEEQAAREAQQKAAHCDALPDAMLPGMVEAQRFRDAGLADAALWARTLTGGDGQVVVIAGSGHADRQRGVPALLAIAAPDLAVLALGQLEEGPDAAGSFDAVLLAPSPAREDPCAAFEAR